MRFKEAIAGSFDKVKQGSWIHFSDHDRVEINLSPSHNDPLGIYLFPASFTPKGHWKNFKFKYEVVVDSSLHVLDLGEMNAKKAIELAAKAKIPFDAQMQAFVEKTTNVGGQFWAYLKDVSHGNQATFTKLIRRMGFDAVFDDVGAIHMDEVQLIVLDPAKIKITKKETMRFKETVYAKYTVLAADVVTLYHGSHDPKLTEVKDRVTAGLDFGGIFASQNRNAAASHGEYVYQIELARDEILDDIPDTEQVLSIILHSTSLNASDYEKGKDDEEYEFDLNLLTSAIIDEEDLFSFSNWVDFGAFSSLMKKEDKDEESTQHEIEKTLEQRILGLFGKGDLGEASWEAQTIRGKIARKLGYKAVSTKDEHGTSYIVLPGVKLTLLTEDA